MANRHDVQHIHYGAPAKPEEKKAPKPSYFEIGFQATLGAMTAVGGTVLAVFVLSWLLHACCNPYSFRCF